MKLTDIQPVDIFADKAEYDRQKWLRDHTMTHYTDKDYFTGPQTRLKGVIVTGNKPKRSYSGYSEPLPRRVQPTSISDLTKGVHAVVNPALAWFSPSQYVGAFRDTDNAADWLRSMMRGNSGFVTKEFEEKHPWFSLATNMAGDAATIGGAAKGFKYAWEAIPTRANLVGYGVNPRFSKMGPDISLYPDFRTMTRAEKIQYLKTQQELAQRVDQARTMDALHLTQDRVRKGGYQRLIESMEDDLYGNNPEAATVVVQPEIPKVMLNKNRKNIFGRPLKGTAKDFKKKTGDHQNAKWGGIGGLDKYYGMYSDIKNTLTHLLKRNIGNAHEYVHYLYFPLSRPKGFNSYGKNADYLLGKDMSVAAGAGEVAARGTQLKNYFGLKEGEELTPEIWNYARRHYIADVTDNNMNDLFQAVDTKSPEYSLFLQWLNKHAPAVATGITVTGASNSLNKQ